MGVETLIASTVLTGLSSIGKGFSDMMAGQQSARASRAQALAEQRSEYTRQRINLHKMEDLQKRQIASFAASGLSLQGSPMEYMMESIEDYERDAMIGEMNSYNKQKNLWAQAANAESQGTMSLLTNGVGGVARGVTDYYLGTKE